MELAQIYFDKWVERQNRIKDRWVEGCQELIINTGSKHRLHYPPVRETLMVYQNGEKQVEGVDFIVLENRCIEFQKHDDYDLPAEVFYTGLLMEQEIWS